MRVLLLSAYAAQSHCYWREGLQDMFPDWQWEILELPPRYFSWRVRGNPLHWSIDERARLERDYDMLVATSMVDLATLRGLVPGLCLVPSLLYFHENQFAYPQSGQQNSLLEAQMVSLYSALAADRLAFNSAYNRDTFLVGLEQLLQRLPDRVPDGVVEGLRRKSVLLPVPVRAGGAAPQDPWPERQGRELRILWSARFEHDKGGEGLLAILRELESGGLDFRLALTGKQFRSSPAVFAEIRGSFAQRLAHFGFVDSRAEYLAWQRGADIVLSTALHEFQGLAVMEAVSLGCEPVLPDRLAYRDFFPSRFRYPSHPGDPQREAAAAAAHIRAVADRGAGTADISACAPQQLQGQYRALFEELALSAKAR